MALLKYQLQTLDLIPLIRQNSNSKLHLPNTRQLLKFLFSVLALQLLFSTKFIRISLYTCAAEFWKSSHTDLGITPSVVSSFHALTYPRQFLAAPNFDLRLLFSAWTVSPVHRADWRVLSWEKPVKCGSHPVCFQSGKCNISSRFCLLSVDMKRRRNRHRYASLSRVYNCYCQETVQYKLPYYHQNPGSWLNLDFRKEFWS